MSRVTKSVSQVPPEQFEESNLEDRVLADLVREGDEAAFEVLFKKYHSRLCSFVNTYTGAREISREIVQAVFQKLWEDRPNLVITSTLRGYLYQCGRNLALDYLKHREVERRWREEALAQEYLSRSLEDLVCDQELHEAFDRGLASLPGGCRLIFTLHFDDRLTYKEIAAVLGLSIKTVETQMGRALKKLRRHLTPFLTTLLFL